MGLSQGSSMIDPVFLHINFHEQAGAVNPPHLSLDTKKI